MDPRLVATAAGRIARRQAHRAASPTGLASIHLFRLLDAPALKEALAESAADLALIVSQYLYDEVITNSPGLIQAHEFRPVAVQVKETLDRGWIWLPPGRSRRDLDGPTWFSADQPIDALASLAGRLYQDLGLDAGNQTAAVVPSTGRPMRACHQERHALRA